MVESAPYTVAGIIGEVELRRYPELVLATVEDRGDDSGFQLLVLHITGNSLDRDIEETDALRMLFGEYPARMRPINKN